MVQPLDARKALASRYDQTHGTTVLQWQIALVWLNGKQPMGSAVQWHRDAEISCARLDMTRLSMVV
jgi:hypothetical protein